MGQSIKEKLQKVFDKAMDNGNLTAALVAIDRLQLIEKEEAEKKEVQ